MLPIIYLTIQAGGLILYISALVYLSAIIMKIRQGTLRQELPGVSVVISLHNESKNCSDLIAHLKAQAYDREKLDFILIDDRSTDSTYFHLIRLTNDDPRFAIIRIEDLLPGFAPKKRALDTAIQQSKREIILHTDADGRPGPFWVQSMAELFTPDTGMVLGYAPYSQKPGAFIQKILALEYFSQAAVAAATTAMGHPATCVGTNLAYRRNLYESLNGFGHYRAFTSGDDDLFLTRVRSETNTTIRYCRNHESFVYNEPPSSWNQFYHQRLRFASKGLDYDLKTTAGLIVLYLFNFLMLVSPLLLLANLSLWPWLILMWLGKAGFEYLFMRKAMHLFQHFYSLPVFIVAFILHVPYVVWFGTAAQFLSYQWKDQVK